jgi:hypothetical protein
VTGTVFAIHNNAADIRIANGRGKGCTAAIMVVGDNNNAGIVAEQLTVDATFVDVAVLNGATGANCKLGPFFGPTTGDIVGAARSNILYDGIPVHSAAVASLLRTVSAANLGAGATYAVAANISTTAWTFTRGEEGWIEVRLPYSGANAATQNVQITLPAGMVVDSGTGWSAANLYLGAAAGRLSELVPYYCTADGTGNVTVTNQAGNTLTVANQAYCGVRRKH